MCDSGTTAKAARSVLKNNRHESHAQKPALYLYVPGSMYQGSSSAEDVVVARSTALRSTKVDAAADAADLGRGE